MAGMTQEQRAREVFDDVFRAAGWIVQDRARINLQESYGAAVREVPISHSYA